MLIIPAIDILNGKCVRLYKGDFEKVKVYSDDPVQMAKIFKANNAQMIHLVDLDGAKCGTPINFDIIAKVIRESGLMCQVGGGIRTLSDIENYLNVGAKRIILGTKAVESLEFVKQVISKFGPEKILVGVDIKNDKVVVNGWVQNSTLNYLDFIKDLMQLGVQKIVLTDVSKDGALMGPNYELLSKVQALGIGVVASGGVSDFDSLMNLKKIGIESVIVGTAIYENKIDLKRSLQKLNSNLAKRIIPCLDVKDGRVVKGTNFDKLFDLGCPVELAKYYVDQGADELVFLDISATNEGRQTMLEIVESVSLEVFIPLTVGGGISSVEQVKSLLRAGADKVSLNTAAVFNPSLITEAAQTFGSQAVVVAVDVKKVGSEYKVYTNAGFVQTDLDLVAWLKEIEFRQAGEILLTSIDRDGTALGYDLELLKLAISTVNIPIIASGGAGDFADFYDVFNVADVDAVLAARVFHTDVVLIPELKKYLKNNNLNVRI